MVWPHLGRVLTKKPKRPKGQPESPWCGRKDLRARDTCTYTVQVFDSTDFVRNPTYQQDALTSTINWTVQKWHGNGHDSLTW